MIRGARLRAGKSYIKSAMQHLFPMELSCDKNPVEDIVTNVRQEKAVGRLLRDAAIKARERIANIARNELDELD